MSEGDVIASGPPGKQRPLIRRPWIYDHLPQVPTWFCNYGHLAARQRFLAKLTSSYRWEHLGRCPNCTGQDLVHVANQERHGLPISVDLCTGCALVFTNPRLSAESLNDLYARDYRDIERGDIPDLHRFMYSLQASKGEKIWASVRTAALPGQILRRVADIGCGEGGLLGWVAANDREVSPVGYELNVDASQYGRDQGLDVRTTLFTRSAGKFDVIMLEQVLEHMHEPALLLAEIAAAQEDGALLYIGVPGLFEYPAHYDGNLLTYLDYAHMYHFCLYTLERLVTPCGYQLVSGSEAVHAVFRRVSGVETALVTPPVTGPQMLAFLNREEEAFRRKGSHFLRYNGGYRHYLKLLAWYRLKLMLGTGADLNRKGRAGDQ